MMVQQPEIFQNVQEEVGILIVFFVSWLSGRILVRASDTDVLVILLGCIGKRPPEVSSGLQIVMDCGVG